MPFIWFCRITEPSISDRDASEIDNLIVDDIVSDMGSSIEAVEIPPSQWPEKCEFDSFFCELIYVFLRKISTSYAVYEQSDFHTFFCFLFERFLYCLAKFSILPDEIGDIDRFMGFFYLQEQICQELFTICQDSYR